MNKEAVSSCKKNSSKSQVVQTTVCCLLFPQILKQLCSQHSYALKEGASLTASCFPSSWPQHAQRTSRGTSLNIFGSRFCHCLVTLSSCSDPDVLLIVVCFLIPFLRLLIASSLLCFWSNASLAGNHVLEGQHLSGPGCKDCCQSFGRYSLRLRW